MYRPEPIEGMIVKVITKYLKNFLWHGKIKQVFLLYDAPPLAMKSGAIVYFSIRNVGLKAKGTFLSSEFVDGYIKNAKKRTTLENKKIKSEIKRLLSKYGTLGWGWHTAKTPTQAELRSFFTDPRFKGVRGIFTFEHIEAINVPFKKVYDTLRVSPFPTGIGYRYLTKSEVRKVEKLL